MYYNICVIPEVNDLKLGKPIVISSKFPFDGRMIEVKVRAVFCFQIGQSENVKTTPTKLKVNRMIYTEHDVFVFIRLVA